MLTGSTGLRKHGPLHMNRIDTLFQHLSAEPPRLMPFVTAGDPDLATTALLISEIVKSGAHLLEIGIPYSDPIADGPVIAASYHRALEGGVKVAHIFQTLRTLRAEGSPRFNETPLVAMVSFAIVHRFGVERFLNDAATSGARRPDRARLAGRGIGRPPRESRPAAASS